MSKGKTILVADDEDRILRVLESALSESGYAVLTARDGDEVVRILGEEPLDLILTDLNMPGRGGIEILEHLRANEMAIPVIVITAYGTIDSAVRAMKLGAFDYLAKPFNLDELELLVERALRGSELARDNHFLKARDRTELDNLVGCSQSIADLIKQIVRVAASDSTVLVTGETGTGKELVARALYSLGPRSDRLFVPINCAAIPRDLLESELFGHVRGSFSGATKNRVGKFELADQGTLFLDEIGDMPIDLQAKILRVLEEGTVGRVGSNREVSVDVRVIAATNQNLAKAAAGGRFRSDLFYRLNVIELSLPPLRERREDVPPLVARFMQEFASRSGRDPLLIGEDALALLADYPWPGNVRELRNVCERLFVLCEGDLVSSELVCRLVDISDSRGDRLHRENGVDLTLADVVGDAEIEAINAALAKTGGRKPEAAQLLGIGERTLWYKLKRYSERIQR